MRVLLSAFAMIFQYIGLRAGPLEPVIFQCLGVLDEPGVCIFSVWFSICRANGPTLGAVPFQGCFIVFGYWTGIGGCVFHCRVINV